MRGLLTFCLRVLLAGLVLAALALFTLGTLFLQDSPLLTAPSPPDARDVATTRVLVRNIRTAAERDGGRLVTDADQLNSALRLGARFIPGFRGQVQRQGAYLQGSASIPVPWWDGQRWVNVIARAPQFQGRLTLSDVFVGEHSLPPGLTLELARLGANLALGDSLGDTALGAATAMQIREDDLVFNLTLGEMGKNGLMRGTFGALKGDELPTADEIEAYHVQIRTAMEDGRLSETGSFLPYLRFTLAAAQAGPADKPLPHRYTAAILGLAKACGAADFALIVGRLVFAPRDTPHDWQAHCDNVTLNGRIDTRRHFLTSAALQAISNTGFAVSAGEFKELYDTISGAGGFDFTDMAANLSGIALSDALMTAPAPDWPALLARLDREADVIVAFDGIPPLMPESEFEARFGDIDSPAYGEMIARIEARIAALRLYQGPQRGIRPSSSEP